MPYFYGTGNQQSTNSSASTDTMLFHLQTAAAGARAYVQKLQAGVFSNALDNQVRLQLVGVDVLGDFAAGAAIVPSPLSGDAPAASATASTLPTETTATLEPVPRVTLAYNTRGTAMWAAFTPSEAIGLVGAAVPNQHIVLNSQSTGTSVAVPYTVIHSE